jgi:ferredoxin-NADP reductase/Na+-transporting NADH:ubiquinone oxidoreductase subunit NqrB
MIKVIDRLLDRITMYWVLLYFLIILIAAAAGLSAIGVLGYNPLAIILSAAYLAVVCGVTNAIFAYVFEVPAGLTSTYITALILALIITPVASLQNVAFLTAAGGLAIASKYILAIHKKHLFNPAAVAVLLLSIGAGQSASWWVGNAALTPIVVVGGLLMARKIRRMRMVLTFFAVAFVTTMLVSLLTGGNIMTSVRTLTLHSSLFFLGFVMLTEPLSTPGTQTRRTWYASLVGLLFPPQMHVLSLYSTPELALVVGNVLSYLVSPKVRLLPKLRQKLRLAPDIADFVFTPERQFSYQAGQYVEVTLGHKHSDARGNRRYLTLASSPTEDTLRFGVKFYPKGSSFKRALLAASDSPAVAISPPAGDFVLSKDPSQKLVFIAGGIGVTPYRSMIKYLLDSGQRRDVAMIYAEKRAEEFVYTDIFEQAQRQLGAKMMYAVQDPPAGWQGHTGYITPELITAEIPDYRDRLFYISGSLPMVTAVTKVLRGLGIPSRRIKTDYFSGYA